MNLFSAVILTDGGGGGDFIHALLVLIIVELVLGIFLWLVSIVPLIPAFIKQVITWLIYGLMALVLINFLLALIGHPLFRW